MKLGATSHIFPSCFSGSYTVSTTTCSSEEHNSSLKKWKNMSIQQNTSDDKTSQMTEMDEMSQLSQMSQMSELSQTSQSILGNNTLQVYVPASSIVDVNQRAMMDLSMSTVHKSGDHTISSTKAALQNENEKTKGNPLAICSKQSCKKDNLSSLSYESQCVISKKRKHSYLPPVKVTPSPINENNITVNTSNAVISSKIYEGRAVIKPKPNEIMSNESQYSSMKSEEIQPIFSDQQSAMKSHSSSSIMSKQSSSVTKQTHMPQYLVKPSASMAADPSPSLMSLWMSKTKSKCVTSESSSVKTVKPSTSMMSKPTIAKSSSVLSKASSKTTIKQPSLIVGKKWSTTMSKKSTTVAPKRSTSKNYSSGISKQPLITQLSLLRKPEPAKTKKVNSLLDSEKLVSQNDESPHLNDTNYVQKLIKGLKNVQLIQDVELEADTPDLLWNTDFATQKMSTQFWDSIDSWSW